jgi:excinuclease ABC subunit A
MESLSSYAKRFVAQVAKPDVDFVYGLSPVISIEQKTIGSNPRSTVGTMTDIASYLNLLFATIGEPHCPRTGEPTPSRTASQILEAILSLPEGAEIELRAPVFKQYGEELDFVLTEVRKKGCRQLIIDGKRWTSPPRSNSTNRSQGHGRGGGPVSWSAASTRRRSRPGSPPRCWWATG